MASSSSITFLLSLLLIPLLSHAATFNVVNECSYTVWAAALPGGGQQLDPGESWIFTVNPGTAGGRIWARTDCYFDVYGRGSCQTGDCDGVLECTGSGTATVTFAEYSLNQTANLDYYDISLVDAFNIPMDFAPTAGGCKDIICSDQNCPDAYHYPTDNTKTFSCSSGTDYRINFCP